MNVGKNDSKVNGLSRSSEIISSIKAPIDLASERGLPDQTWAMADAAKWYANIGWKVFPVNRSDKKPLIKDWPNDASSDHQQIEAWWEQHPTAMIGVVCGSRSGVAVVDADVKPDGDGIENLSALESEFGDLGKLPTVRSAGCGVHVYFSADSLPFEKNEDRIGHKIDLRSSRPDDGGSGYIIVPPSRRLDGKRYEWRDTTVEQLVDLPEAPDWLALRACFDEAERKTIDADQSLRASILAQSRPDWRSAFNMRREGERRLRNPGRD